MSDKGNGRIWYAVKMACVVIALAIPVWPAWLYFTAVERDRCVAEIERSGGSVVLSKERDPSVSESILLRMKWFTEWLSISVDEICLDRVPVTTELMVVVSKLRSARTVSMRDTGLTDQQLTVLRPIKSLELLDVSGSNVTDRSVSSLSEFPKLRELFVTRTAVSEQAVTKLRSDGRRLEVYQ